MSGWVVCIRDIPGGEDVLLGPFWSLDAAEVLRARCERQLRRQGEWWQDGGSTDAVLQDIVTAREWRSVVEDGQ